MMKETFSNLPEKLKTCFYLFWGHHSLWWFMEFSRCSWVLSMIDSALLDDVGCDGILGSSKKEFLHEGGHQKARFFGRKESTKKHDLLHEGNTQNKVCPKYDKLFLTLICNRDSDIICTKDQSVQLYRSKVDQSLSSPVCSRVCSPQRSPRAT